MAEIIHSEHSNDVPCLFSSDARLEFNQSVTQQSMNSNIDSLLRVGTRIKKMNRLKKDFGKFSPYLPNDQMARFEQTFRTTKFTDRSQQPTLSARKNQKWNNKVQQSDNLAHLLEYNFIQSSV